MNPAISDGGKRILRVLFAVLVVFLYAPVIALVVLSFNDNEIVSLPWAGFTLRWYEQFVQEPAILDALRTSVLVALLCATVATAIAIPAAIALVRRDFFGKNLLTGLFVAPLVVPLVAIGIALLILFSTIGVPLSPLTVVIGHVVVAMPYAILMLMPRLERIPPSLEEASRDLGASALRTFRLVTMPLLVPALVSSFLIAFTISFDEVVIASFVAGEHATFPVYLYSQLRLPERLPMVIAVAVVVLVISVVLALISEIVRIVAERRLEAQTGIAAEDFGSLRGGKG